MNTWLDAPRRKALYLLAAGIGTLAVFYGLMTEAEAMLWVGLIPVALNVFASTKTVDPVAVEDKESPTGESAGEASLLPDETPTITEPAPGVFVDESYDYDAKHDGV